MPLDKPFYGDGAVITGGGGKGKGDKGKRKVNDGNPKRHHLHPEAGVLVVLRKLHGRTKRGLLERPFYFQIPPLDNFGWEKTHTWEDYVTIRRGTFTREGGRELKAINLSTLVIDHNPSWAVLAGGDHHQPKRRNMPDEPGGDAPSPIRVGRYLEKLLDSGTPFRLIARNRHLWGTSDLDLAVTLRSVVLNERAGEIDSRYFDMSFMEYREPKMRRKGYGKDEKLPVRVTVKRDGSVVEDEKGKHDKNPKTIGSANNPATLRRLAKHYYHRSGAWREISKKNGIKHFSGEQSLAELWTRGRKFRRLVIPKLGKGDGGKGGGGPTVGGHLDDDKE